MPQFTPINSFSALLATFTRSSLLIPALYSSLKAKAVRTSIEADEESPDPVGIFP
ncbi:hypothetical protein D3C78_1686970 [compost metagenome]